MGRGIFTQIRVGRRDTRRCGWDKLSVLSPCYRYRQSEGTAVSWGGPGGVGRSRGRVWAALPDSPLALPQLGLRNDALLREIRAAQQRLGFGDPAL